MFFLLFVFLTFFKKPFLLQTASYLSVAKTQPRCNSVVRLMCLCLSLSLSLPPFLPICTVSHQTEACVPDQGIALMLAASREAYPSIPSDTPAAALP